MKALTEALSSLSPRERFMVILGGAAALAIVLYAFIWQPWQAELERLRGVVPHKQETLEWMRVQAAWVAAQPERSDDASFGSGLPLLTLVERSANQAQMRDAITRMSPGEEGDQVRVWLDNVAFDPWLLWVDALNDSGVRIAEASIDRSGDNLVSIRATLQR
jgi:general secretion pathway protein M